MKQVLVVELKAHHPLFAHFCGELSHGSVTVDRIKGFAFEGKLHFEVVKMRAVRRP